MKSDRTTDTTFKDEFDTINLLIVTWHVSISKYEIIKAFVYMLPMNNPHNHQPNNIVLTNVNHDTNT